MKSFTEYITETKPVYVRNEGEFAYDLSDDVFKPGISSKDTRETLRAKLKILRNVSLPKDWKGMTS